MLEALVAGAVGYLVGAVPTGVLVGRAFTGKDVRGQGSGHTGGLNVFRLAGLGPMLLTAVVDVFLGVAAVALSGLLSDNPWVTSTAGVMAVVGHDWSIYIGLEGGIGLAKLFGTLLYLAPLHILAVAVAIALLWITLMKPLRVHRARATIFVMVLVGPALYLAGLPLPMVVQGALGGLVVILKTIPDWNRVYPSDGV